MEKYSETFCTSFMGMSAKHIFPFSLHHIAGFRFFPFNDLSTPCKSIVVDFYDDFNKQRWQ